MISSKTQQLLLVGLPGAGKTSFLAALWYMVDQTSVRCQLALEKLEGDRKYLNQIRDAWAEYKPVPRNQFDKEKLVSMLLRNQDTNGTTQLSFPDLSGEAFRLQWTKRQMTRSYDQQLRDSSGALLFVHPSSIIKPHRIDQLEEASLLVTGSFPSGVDSSTNVTKTKPWDPEKSPTQVQLIELLQVIALRRTYPAPFRLAIVVSAFDLAAGSQLTPANFIARELPMLKQYLDANGHLFECSCYGISAQGGEYRSPEFLSTMIRDAEGIKKRITAGQEMACQWLHEQLDEPTKAVLADTAIRPDLKSSLVEGLNVLLSRSDLFEKARFAQVSLSTETQYRLDTLLLKDSKERTDVMGLNRMLLEDLFAGELAKEWTNDAEHAGLVQRHPAARVSVVGVGVVNERDITEPIKWLMR